MAISERVGSHLETAVVLVNMQGEIVGEDGDLRRWI
jgi:hypothetical protein